MTRANHSHPKLLVDLVRAAHGAGYAEEFRDYDFDAETLYRFSDICTIDVIVGDGPCKCVRLH